MLFCSPIRPSKFLQLWGFVPLGILQLVTSLGYGGMSLTETEDEERVPFLTMALTSKQVKKVSGS